MSKSKGNLISPEAYFASVGADALRLFHLFVGPPGDNVDWTSQSDEVIEGCRTLPGPDLAFRGRTEDRRRLSVAAVDRDTDEPREAAARAATRHAPPHRQGVRGSGAVELQHSGGRMHGVRQPASALLQVGARPSRRRAGTRPSTRFCLLLAPMAPHMTAEAWERRHGEGTRIHSQTWPIADPALVARRPGHDGGPGERQGPGSHRGRRRHRRRGGDQLWRSVRPGWQRRLPAKSRRGSSPDPRRS